MSVRGASRRVQRRKQRLVVGSDLKRFMTSAPTLFPGAQIRTVEDCSDGATWITRTLELLIKTQDRVVPTKALSRHIGKPWRTMSRDVLTLEFMSNLTALGWCYVPLKGRAGARFERIPLIKPQ
jgi:hypothetical protein